MPEKEIKIVGSLNLWENNFWEERREGLLSELKEQGFASGQGVVLTLQEVRKGKFDSLKEIAQALGFQESGICFFPVNYNRTFGMAVLTDLQIVRKELHYFSGITVVPKEAGIRAIALVELLSGKKKTAVGVVHFGMDQWEQFEEGADSLQAMKTFIIEGLRVADSRKLILKSQLIRQFFRYRNIVIAGDFNAEPSSALYKLFILSGLYDWTVPLRKGCEFTWPSDTEWFIGLHLREWGEEPRYPVRGRQRWMDYLWGHGLVPKEVFLFGDKKHGTAYISDHLGVGARF